MTHGESQDLLVDLAFGELDPVRAAEVTGHLAGCAECQREKAALDEARRAAAPLRELEEPSAGFDDRILAAARAQAQLTHDGNIGQVIEAQGSVRPLGLEAAQIDAHRAPVLATRRRPRWAMRVALGGSVAAAAALALVVSTSLESRRVEERMARLAAGEKQFEIRVQPAPMQQAASEAVRDARKEEGRMPADLARDDEEAADSRKAPAKLAKKARRAEPDLAPAGTMQGISSGARGAVSGSGGDALGGLADKDTQGLAQAKQAPASAAPPPPSPPAAAVANPPPPPAREVARTPPQPKMEVARTPPPPPAAAVASSPPPQPKREVASTPPAPPAKEAADGPPPQSADAVVKNEPAREKKAVAAHGPARAAAESVAPRAPTMAVASTTAARPLDAVALEQAAQESRHGGEYLKAAALYRNAAAVRRAAGEQGGEPAWDLAHAIECLAAVGEFDQARQVRAELANIYPSEKSAFIAAGRALREVDSPAAAAAAPPAKAAPRPESKSKATEEKQGTVPADF